MAVELPVDLIRDLIGVVQKLPTFDMGKAYFTSDGWKTIEFNETFEEPPVVSVKFESPEGWPADQFPFIPPGVVLEKLELKAIAELEDVVVKHVDIPDLETIKVTYEGQEILFKDWVVIQVVADVMGYIKGCKVLAKLIDLAKAAGIGDDLISSLENAIKGIARIVVGLTIRFVKKYVIPFFTAVLNHAREGIKDAIWDLRDKAQARLNDLKNNAQSVLNKFKSNLQDAFDTVTLSTCDAYNLSFDRYYESMGLQKDYLAIPAMVKQGSVTNTQFEVWSPGAGTLHWHAMGRPSVVGQPIIKKLQLLIEPRR